MEDVFVTAPSARFSACGFESCLRPVDIMVPALEKGESLNERVRSGWKCRAGETIPGGNRLRGNVTAFVPQGPFLKVEIDCGLRIVAAVSGNLVRDLAFQPGSAVTIVLRPADLYVIPKG